MKKFKIGIISAFALVIALSTSFFFGCGQKDYSKINFNEVTHSIFYAPFYAAINLGYFEEEGLEINLTNGGGSNVSMAALVSGSADMILAGPETVVYTSQEGVTDQPKVFGQLTQTDGSFIVAKNKSDKPFEITDLIGKTIIGGRAGGLPAMTLQYAVESYGLEIGTGENQVNINDNVAFNNIASEFVNSDAEYCTLFEPNASNLIAEHPEYEIVAVGPTTSMRMNPYQKDVIALGPKIVIGKGGMDDTVREALKEHNAIYVVATGGCAALYVDAVEKIESVDWLDLGMPEAMWNLKVDSFGPLIVAMDSHGNSLYD